MAAGEVREDPGLPRRLPVRRCALARGRPGPALHAREARLGVGGPGAAVARPFEVHEVVEGPQHEVEEVDILAHVPGEQASGQRERPGDTIDRGPRLRQQGGHGRVPRGRGQGGDRHARHRRRGLQLARSVNAAVLPRPRG